MAGCSSSFARETRSSGREAPSRKLNAEAECSSTYFNRRFLPRTSASHAGPYRLDRVQSRFHSPRVPLELWDVTSYLDVPFFARPRRFGPPVTFSSPRSSERKDLPANTFAAKEPWLSILKPNRCL